MELVPIHPILKVQDWDRAEGAISWDRMAKFLRQVKAAGEIPPDHRSHDHLNEQKEIKVDDHVQQKWMDEFKRLKENNTGEKIVWGLVDGFLLYWHPVRLCIVHDHCDLNCFPSIITGSRRRVGHQNHAACASRCAHAA